MNLFLGCVLSLMFTVQTGRAGVAETAARSDLASYLDQRSAEFELIDAPRREVLDQLAAHVRLCHDEGREAQLVFICTHNSRRSQLAQVWAAIAARRLGLDHVRTFSGGTETTAFNPRAVATLRRAGVEVTLAQSSESNPVFLVRLEATDLSGLTAGEELGERPQQLACFSKRHDSAPNPAESFCAIFACTEADEACPTVTGSQLRIALPFIDPKVADGTPAEQATYDERSTQICREMLYVMSRAAEDK